MKVILCGYNWIGCEVLSQLVNNSEITDCYVYTHENPPHVVDLRAYCDKLKVGVTIDNISVDNLPFAPDIICSIYYRHIIEKDVIKICKGKIFNLHPSVLPEYKGCSSITWAMINGESSVGFTYHYIDEGVDTGNIIYQQVVDLKPFETQQSMYYRIMIEGARPFRKVFDLVKDGYQGEKQEKRGTYYKRGAPFDGEIKNEWDQEKIERFIRAMNSPPLPYAKFKGSEVRTFEDYLNKRME